MSVDNRAKQEVQKGVHMPEVQPINYTGDGCMDGRPTIGIYRKQDGQWTEVVGAMEAANLVEAHLPGGDLGYVAALQKFAGLSVEQAIDATQHMLEAKGQIPQFHIDNDHGEVDVHGLSQQERDSFLDNQNDGCGFAKLMWPENVIEVIQMLKDKGWRMEVLDGHHGEVSAARIEKVGQAIKAADAVAEGQSAFTYNVPEAKINVEALATIVGKPEFAEAAMTWFDEQFALIADKLREIKTVDTIAE